MRNDTWDLSWRACLGCGEVYTWRRKTQKFCSRECQRGTNGKPVRNVPRERPCEHCGKTYRAARTDQRFCSRECRTEWRNRALGSPAAVVERTCDYCGSPFTSTRAHQRFCRRACASYFYGADHIARAKRYGVPWEQFASFEVFERDGWLCGICGDPVDRRLTYPDPMSASLDHIKPLSKGGGHLRSNAQCAHWECNVRKSDTVAEAVLVA